MKNRSSVGHQPKRPDHSEQPKRPESPMRKRCGTATAVKDWDELFSRMHIRDGIRISFHHHLRFGDSVVEQVLGELERRGIKDLTLCLSSVMGSACSAIVAAVRSGTVTALETTGLKEPLSGMVLRGELPSPVVFRTHGGRARAVRTGELPIQAAFIAASAADEVGNLNGVDGASPFGSMGYAMVDARYAAVTAAVTDTVLPGTLEHISIPAEQVDFVMTADSIGDNSLLSNGTLRSASSSLQRIIAARTRDLLIALGAVKEGWSFQGGSGVISLLVMRMAAEFMRERRLHGSFASGGITGTLTGLLQEGLFRELWDVQSFDLAAAESLRRNGNHHEMSVGKYADPGIPDHIAGQLDVMIISAAEADHQFNINSLTGTNGRIIGALGGAPDTAEGAGLTIAVLPALRGRIPTIHERVRTICTPGRYVDAIVTECGIAVNPRREDILCNLHDASGRFGFKLAPIESITERIRRISGIPEYPRKDGRCVGIVERRDGMVLDTVAALPNR